MKITDWYHVAEFLHFDLNSKKDRAKHTPYSQLWVVYCCVLYRLFTPPVLFKQKFSGRVEIPLHHTSVFFCFYIFLFPIVLNALFQRPLPSRIQGRVIWGGVDIITREIKYTMNVMPSNHPQVSSPPCPRQWKNWSSTKPVPGAKKTADHCYLFNRLEQKIQNAEKQLLNSTTLTVENYGIIIIICTTFYSCLL